MPEKPWKRAERQVAKRLGGQRVKRHGEAAPDVVAPHLVAEVKLRAQLPLWLCYALASVRLKAKSSQLPIVVLKEGGSPRQWVVMDLSDFEDWFGPIAAKKGDKEEP